MWGTRFLSAFLKVNPYFTLCLAVGFSGVAAIGFNHREAEKSLNKLIPLHLRAAAPDRAPDIITSDVQGIEHAREVIQKVLHSQGGELPQAPGSLGHILLSDPPAAPIRQSDDPSIGAGLPIDYGFTRDVPDPPRYDPDKSSGRTTPPAGDPGSNTPSWHDQPPPGPGPGAFFPPSFPSPPSVQPIVPSSIFSLPSVMEDSPSPPIDAPPGEPPPDFVPPDSGPPMVLPPSDPGTVSVDVAEPRMVFAFAALLPLLMGFRRRGQRHGMEQAYRRIVG